MLQLLVRHADRSAGKLNRIRSQSGTSRGQIAISSSSDTPIAGRTRFSTATRRVWRRSTVRHGAARRAAPANTGNPARRSMLIAAPQPVGGWPASCHQTQCALASFRQSHATPARRQSCMCRNPVGRTASSTTNRAVIAKRFISPSASAARCAGVIVFGFAAHDFRNRAGEQPIVHVTTQIAIGDDADETALAVAHADTAEALRGHHEDRFRHRRPRRRPAGSRRPQCMMSATRSRRRPRRPPGWNSWKSAGENPLRSNSAIASASPSAIIIVVEVVGARPIGQASAAHGNSSTTSAACASVEFASGR